MEFTKSQKAVLMGLTEHPGWELYVKHLDEYRKELALEMVQGHDAFTTLRSLHQREGKLEILKELLEDFERDINS